jgi:chromosome segregation ATPase
VVTALRALPHADATVMGDRGAVEQHVLSLDERLVAVATLPETVRSKPRAQLSAEVEHLETATAELVAQLAHGDTEPDEAFQELSDALSYLKDATAEVQALESPSRSDHIPQMLSHVEPEQDGREPPHPER